MGIIGFIEIVLNNNVLEVGFNIFLDFKNISCIIRYKIKFLLGKFYLNYYLGIYC